LSTERERGKKGHEGEREGGKEGRERGREGRKERRRGEGERNFISSCANVMMLGH